MNKRLISLILSAAMLVGVLLTGCSQEEPDDPNAPTKQLASASAKTVSMYVVTENDVSEETAAKVTDAFNQITKAKFKTRVVLHFYTYDNYYTAIEKVIADNAAREAMKEEHLKALKAAKAEAKAEDIPTDSEWFDQFYIKHPEYAEFRETQELTGEDTTAEETETMAISGTENFFITSVKYPEEKVGQLDIIWIDSYDRYMDYIGRDWLSRLDDELTASSKKLKEYISPELLAWAKWAGSGTYAIPNNCVVGEYTYMLLNKKYVDKYNYDPATMSNLASTDTASYLADIAKYEPSLIPIVGDLPVTNTIYWNYNEETRAVDTDKFCILGEYYSSARTIDPSVTTNMPISARNLFGVSYYTDQLMNIQRYKDAGYIRTDVPVDTECALKVVKGGKELESKYSDEYYINVLEYPRISEANVFNSMFAVSSFTNSLSRSMEIVTYLNTNADLRNVLQYGVEGVHYKVKADGTVERLNHDYMMNILNTGNVFIAHPEENADPNIWEYGKLQNLEIKSELLNCFRVPEKYLVPPEGDVKEDDKVQLLDLDQLKTILDASKEVEEKLKNVKDAAELEALISSTAGMLTNAIRTQSRSTEERGLYYIYYNWMQDTQLYVPSED